MLRPPCRRRLRLAAAALLLPLLAGCAAPVSWGGGPAGIYVVGADGMGLRRLVDQPARPAWSPLGDRLAYSDDDGVWVIAGDGSARRRVAASNRAGPPAWSPAGDRLAFVDLAAERLRIVAADGSGERAVPLLDHEPGNDLVAFAIDAPPAWSPDGTRVAFISWDGNGDEVYVADAAGTAEGDEERAPERLSDIPASSRPVSRANPRGQRVAVANAAQPAWSPAGGEIAFTLLAETPGATGGLYLLDVDDGGDERLTRVEPLSGADWSPDARKLLFAAERDEHVDVYVANLRGFGLLANLTRTHAGESRDPVWSPDGGTIAFVSDGDLWLMGADGAGKRLLAGTELRDHSPAWSADGGRLAFVSEQEIG